MGKWLFGPIYGENSKHDLHFWMALMRFFALFLLLVIIRYMKLEPLPQKLSFDCCQRSTNGRMSLKCGRYAIRKNKKKIPVFPLKNIRKLKQTTQTINHWICEKKNTNFCSKPAYNHIGQPKQGRQTPTSYKFSHPYKIYENGNSAALTLHH